MRTSRWTSFSLTLASFLLVAPYTSVQAVDSTKLRELKDSVSAFTGFTDLRECGRCYVVRTSDCIGPMDVVSFSECDTTGCLCSGALRDGLTEYIRHWADSSCTEVGADDEETPKLAVGFFNSFCGAQSAAVEEDAPSTDEQDPDADADSGPGGHSIDGDGNTITDTDDSSNSGIQCGTGDNNQGSITCSGGGADSLALGLGLGLGIPTVVIAVLTL